MALIETSLRIALDGRDRIVGVALLELVARLVDALPPLEMSRWR